MRLCGVIQIDNLCSKHCETSINPHYASKKSIKNAQLVQAQNKNINFYLICGIVQSPHHTASIKNINNYLTIFAIFLVFVFWVNSIFYNFVGCFWKDCG